MKTDLFYCKLINTYINLNNLTYMSLIIIFKNSTHQNLNINFITIFIGGADAWWIILNNMYIINTDVLKLVSISRHLKMYQLRIKVLKMCPYRLIRREYEGYRSPPISLDFALYLVSRENATALRNRIVYSRSDEVNIPLPKRSSLTLLHMSQLTLVVADGVL